jgi:hypothetical protein
MPYNFTYGQIEVTLSKRYHRSFRKLSTPEKATGTLKNDGANAINYENGFFGRSCDQATFFMYKLN